MSGVAWSTFEHLGDGLGLVVGGHDGGDALVRSFRHRSGPVSPHQILPLRCRRADRRPGQQVSLRDDAGVSGQEPAVAARVGLHSQLEAARA